jgi:hypothetical protein
MKLIKLNVEYGNYKLIHLLELKYVLLSNSFSYKFVLFFLKCGIEVFGIAETSNGHR